MSILAESEIIEFSTETSSVRSILSSLRNSPGNLYNCTKVVFKDFAGKFSARNFCEFFGKFVENEKIKEFRVGPLTMRGIYSLCRLFRRCKFRSSLRILEIFGLSSEIKFSNFGVHGNSEEISRFGEVQLLNETWEKKSKVVCDSEFSQENQEKVEEEEEEEEEETRIEREAILKRVKNWNNKISRNFQKVSSSGFSIFDKDEESKLIFEGLKKLVILIDQNFPEIFHIEIRESDVSVSALFREVVEKNQNKKGELEKIIAFKKDLQSSLSKFFKVAEIFPNEPEKHKTT